MTQHIYNLGVLSTKSIPPGGIFSQVYYSAVKTSELMAFNGARLYTFSLNRLTRQQNIIFGLVGKSQKWYI